jgi:DNA polymerase (family 10)
MPPNAHIELAGSYPSGKAESKDIDILFFTDDTTQAMAQVMDALTRAKLLVAVQSSGTGKLLALIRLNAKHPVRHLDVRILPRNAEVFGRFYFTSGRDFNQMVRAHAKQQGYKLNEFGLYDMRHGGKPAEGITSEKELMDAIGLAYMPMNKRR